MKRPNPQHSPDRKTRDAALLLPVFGVLLLASPLLSVFVGGGGVFGIPSPFVYVFGVWAVLIVLGYLLARRMRRPGDGAD